CLENTFENIGFVQNLVRRLVGANEALSADDIQSLDHAVEQVFRLPDPRDRRLASVIAYLDPPAKNNVAKRLQRWVHSATTGNGPLSWVLDNQVDSLNLDGRHLYGI